MLCERLKNNWALLKGGFKKKYAGISEHELKVLEMEFETLVGRLQKRN